MPYLEGPETGVMHGGEFVEAHVLATGLTCIAAESALEWISS